MLRLFSHRYMQIALLLGLLAGMVLIGTADLPMVKRMRQITFDMYNRSMPRPPFVAGPDDPIKGVAIVDIDEKSLRDSQYGQWPWPRWLIARLVDKIHAAGAKAIVFDMVFAELDRTSPSQVAASPTLNASLAEQLKKEPSNEDIFAKSIAAAGNVVTGFAIADQQTGNKPQVKVGLAGFPRGKSGVSVKKGSYAVSRDILVDAAAGNGSFSATPDNDGIIREVPLVLTYEEKQEKQVGYPGLSVEAVRVGLKSLQSPIIKTEAANAGISRLILPVSGASRRYYDVPLNENGYFQVYYAGHRKSLYISAHDVLSDNPIAAKSLKDKIVFVGTSAIGLLDLRSSPLDSILPGVEIHAEIVEQILGQKHFLYRSNFLRWIEWCATVLVSLSIIFIAPFISTGMLAFVATVVIGSGITGALFAYSNYGLLIDPVFPSLTIIIIFILSSILTNLRTEMERRAIKTAFGHYIAPALMEELTSNPEKLKLGGEVRDISVMFTDIRNFTTISEGMDPADLIRMMNDFLTPMTSCVLNNRGTIDKYMGDAMMAFWNAPLDDPDHALHACTAALQMLEALKEVNEALKQAGKNIVLRAGIGINTGKASVGNMGSKQRFAYSALGDTVNLASRLEGQTKGYGVSIMISEEVRRQAPTFAAIEIDLLTVKGRTEPERVYALLGDDAYAVASTYQQIAALQEKLLAAYRAQQWDEASKLAEEGATLRPDLAGLYALYRQRIIDFKANPPPAGWQGGWVAKEKS